MPTATTQTTESLLSEMTFDCPEVFADKDGFAFRAFECAVFENEVNDKRYEYTAFNINSGKSELIDRRRTPLKHTDEDKAAILRKLCFARVAGKGRLEIDSDTALRVEKLRAVMYEVFREVLPRYGYNVRDGQIELAEKLLNAFEVRGTLLAEAAVGIGKTLAYIIVAVLVKRSRLNEHWNTAYFPEMSVVEWKRMPIIVSTASIALQQAIEKDAVPEISRILLENGIIRKPLKAAIVKGKSHYICESNLRAYRSYEKKPEIVAILDRLAIDGRVIDLTGVEGLTVHIKKKICVPARCHKKCPYTKSCRFKDYRDTVRTGDADILICNHNLLFADAKLRADGYKPILPPYQMAVFDEAHEVLQAARSIYGTSLDGETIHDISRAILDLDFAPFETENTEDWRDIRDIAHRLAEKLDGQNKRLFAKSDAGTECSKYLSHIRNLAGELCYVLKKTYALKSKLDEGKRNALLKDLERLIDLTTPMASGGDNIRWFEADDKRSQALYSLPKNLNELIYTDLWKRGVPSMLTSGTLSVGDDFGALKNSVGLTKATRISETTQPSPYDHKRNCLLYIPEHIPFPKQSSSKYMSALTDEIERLIRASNGHSAVLFTSYYVMERVYNELEKRKLPFPLFKLERSTSSAIERFKQSGNGVLMASGSLWQGIDIPGDLLSMLIIAKLPFPQPSAISEYERTLYPDFNAYLESVIIPEMLIKLKQGFGRLLRSVKDTGVVAILDSHINLRGRYRKRVLLALSDCRVTNIIGDITSFLRSVKPLSFWT